MNEDKIRVKIEIVGRDVDWIKSTLSIIYANTQDAIERRETVLSGSGPSFYSVTFPDEPSLTNSEIRQLRKLIKQWPE